MVNLNIVGDFANPWPNPEAKHISAWIWAPGTDTWRAVCGGATTVASRLTRFLGAIEKEKVRSIDRLDFLSHGNPRELYQSAR